MVLDNLSVRKLMFVQTGVWQARAAGSIAHASLVQTSGPEMRLVIKSQNVMQ